MKILIITSESLYPEYTLGSTFELTQAQIISQFSEVAILSVRENSPIFVNIKQFLRMIMSNNLSVIIFFQLLFQLIQSIYSFLFMRNKTNKYLIEGVEVYESQVHSFLQNSSFIKRITLWNKNGYNAFNSYVKNHGFPDLIHAHSRFLLAGCLALEIKKRHKINFVYTEHSTLYKRNLIEPSLVPIIDKVIKNSSLFIAVSSSLLDEVEKKIQKKIPNAAVIPNVLDLIFEKKPLAKKEISSKFIFTTIASLDHKKGLDILISSFSTEFKKYNDVILFICGSGPLEKELKKQISDNHLEDRIFMQGYKSKEEILNLLDITSAFVLPSRVETFGVVVIEALSRGIPVVATKSGGPEFIINKTNGIIVEPENIQALSNALFEIKNSINSYNGESIRENALRLYGSVHFRNTIEKIYKKAIYDGDTRL